MGVVWLVLTQLDISRLAPAPLFRFSFFTILCQQKCKRCGAQFPIVPNPLAGGRARAVWRTKAVIVQNLHEGGNRCTF